MEKHKEKIICPLCDSESVTYFCTKNTYTLYKCGFCKLLFMYPVPESTNIYNESYFSGAKDGFGYVDYDTDKEPMIPTFKKYLDIFGSLGMAHGRLLDVGSATGFFMNIAKNRGFDVFGVEISDFVAEKGRKAGLGIVTGDLLTSHFPDGYFNIITMFDVLEHVTNPKATLLEARRILTKDGLLVINTPDAESFWAKILGKHWQLIMPPEHINYFSPKNLSDYLSKNGFETVVNTKIGKRFTLQYIFKMLYKWQDFRIWNYLADFLSEGFLSKLYIPINLYDNFFIILKKK